MEFPFPILVCDIGGTNVRIASVARPGAELVALAHVQTSQFPGLGECILSALSGKTGAHPKSLLVCGAGPVAKRRLQLTNAHWTVDGPTLVRQLGLSQGLLFNDFEAQALSLPAHRPDWLHAIGPNHPAAPGPHVILGPGTGLGVAALVDTGTRFLSLASEAAHADFAPGSEEDARIWPNLDRVNGRITAESVVSGPGLARLHKARMIADGATTGFIDQVEIVKRGLASPKGSEAATLRHFWSLTGRFAGNMALTFLARGGVTLSGGVLPRIVDLLDTEAFRHSFEDKAPLDGVVKAIPTQLVVAPDVVLAGMAQIAADPDRYEIDYADRAWC